MYINQLRDKSKMEFSPLGENTEKKLSQKKKNPLSLKTHEFIFFYTG